MGSFITLPVTFLVFWFIEAPVSIAKYCGKLNHAFFEFFSLPLLLKTFFKPLKNEYREGLVGFSVGMGIVVKTFLIFFNLLLFIPLIALEALFFVLFLTFPIATVLMLFL